MSARRLGLVTIGQAPRTDVTPDIVPLLGGIELIEAGALDELSPAAIAELAPGEGDAMLVSRLRDGQSVSLSEARMHAHVQGAVDRLVQQGADAVLIICTGQLPGIQSTVPVYTAEALAHGGVLALIGDDALGVVVPEPEQAVSMGVRWAERLGRQAVMVDCDPYTAKLDNFVEVADRLAAVNVDWVFMDCIGYSEEMADAIRARTGIRVLTARTVAARLALVALSG